MGKRHFALRGNRLGQTDGALHELPLVVDERHERNRHVQDPGRKSRESVEGLFGGAVEQTGGAKRAQTRWIANRWRTRSLTRKETRPRHRGVGVSWRWLREFAWLVWTQPDACGRLRHRQRARPAQEISLR